MAKVSELFNKIEELDYSNADKIQPKTDILVKKKTSDLGGTLTKDFDIIQMDEDHQ